MSAADFYTLPQDEQVRRLGELAATALGRWSLEGAEIRPVAYRENMTFGVDAGSRGRFALRVHQAGYRTDAEIQSELDYMDYLSGCAVRTPRVVRAGDGSSFVIAEHASVKEPRQCDLFEWIDGKPLRTSGEPPDASVAEAARMYGELGAQAATVYNASEKWERPEGFVRPRWDVEGIFGTKANLGNFRDCEQASSAQLAFLERLAERLASDLAAFGSVPDRWGLTQGDLLSENVMVCDDGLRLIDFDDAGESWYLFDLATAVFDLTGTEFFEPCVQSYATGYREHRDLPDEHLALLPTFILARLLSYLGHATSRTHLEQSAGLQQIFIALLEEHGAAYLAS